MNNVLKIVTNKLGDRNRIANKKRINIIKTDTTKHKIRIITTKAYSLMEK